MDDSYFTSALAAASMRLLELRLVKSYSVATPAPGAEWSIKVPGGAIWEVIAIAGTFTTSGVAGNRRPAIVYTTQDGRIATFSIANFAAVGVASPLSWVQQLGSTINAGGADVITSLGAPIPLPSSTVVTSLTRGIDAGDQWSAITITVREWSETDIVQEMVEVAAQMDSLTLPLVGRK